ncbi:hypothetical protein ACMDCT_15500 [Halomonadaceae bacterium KBTZ08]
MNECRCFLLARSWLFRLFLFCLAYFLLPYGVAKEPESTHSKELVGLARSYETLQLCSAFALEFRNEEALANRYSDLAQALYEQSKKKGWTPDQFASALVVVNKQMSSMEVRADDTRQSFNRRHYSGKPCEKAKGRAHRYLDKALLAPGLSEK